MKCFERKEIIQDESKRSLTIFTKFFTYILAVCSLLLTTACTTPLNGAYSKGQNLDRASFISYWVELNAREANQVFCDYGPLNLASFRVIPVGENRGIGSATYWKVYPHLKCNWLSADGTAREEDIPMTKLQPTMAVEWTPFEGKLYKEKLLQFPPTIRIEIKNKLFRITRKFKVQLYGEQLAERSWRIRTEEVKQIIYEHE